MTNYGDRTVVITGAGGAIGSALARRFARERARIVLIDNSEERLKTLRDVLHSCGSCPLVLPADIAQPDACTSAIDRALMEFGSIDILINNAGITQFGLCEHTRTDVYRSIFDVNFFGSVNCTIAALPALIASKGAIGVISSIAGFAPLLGRAGYCASKHALHGYFDTLRCEVRRHGIYVTLICPGFTESDLEKRALAADGSISVAGRTQVGATASPDDVADAAYAAITARRRIVVLSSIGKISRLIRTCAPSLYDRVMTNRLKAEFDRDSQRQKP